MPVAERAEHKRQFAEILKRWNQPGRLLGLTYSTVGLRGDVDMVLWRICYSVDDLNQMTAELLASPLGGYLQTPHNFLAMTKRSQYLIGHEHERSARFAWEHPAGRAEVHLHLSLLEDARVVFAADGRAAEADERAHSRGTHVSQGEAEYDVLVRHR